MRADVPKSREAPPRASAMIEALRGLGYSPAAAIADIIDNSISAKADLVDVTFHWAGADSWLTIADNGRGMSDAELEAAMRLGERSPLDERSKSDLGRFGLGMKTASFSQSRRLTVSSRRKDAVSTLRWDLDVLRSSKTGGWHLLEGAAPGSEQRLTIPGEARSGTVILWEVMDRLTPAGARQQDFLDMIDRVEKHLAMVFHRLIAGRKLKLRINGALVAPWDPFLEGRLDTIRLGQSSFVVGGHRIATEAFVLPHKDRLDEKTWQSAAGPDGWTSQQGFYVYRNDRMLVAGSWLGLGRGRSWTKEEAFRLARIRVDLPNSADADWNIDIRKSTARPPPEARHHLTALAEKARDRARRVFAFRGRTMPAGKKGPVVQAWRAEHTTTGVRYRIDRSHPAISAVLDEAGAPTALLSAMLRVIEETVPVQQIWLDTAEARETPRTKFSELPPAEVRSVMDVIFRNLTGRKGMSVERARAQMLLTEPFDSFPEYVSKLGGKQES